jgi:hypothetical protein
MKAPKGTYPSGEPFGSKFKASGEFREPKKGEWYLSGAIVEAYRSPNDLSTKYWIAVSDNRCKVCNVAGPDHGHYSITDPGTHKFVSK